MIETFRDGIPSVMPEIFNQASTSSVIPKIQSGIHVFPIIWTPA